MKINIKSISLALFSSLAVTTLYASNSLADHHECCSEKENQECEKETCNEEAAEKTMKDGKEMAEKSMKENMGDGKEMAEKGMKETMKDGKEMAEKSMKSMKDTVDVKSGMEKKINEAKQAIAGKANSAVNSATGSIVPSVPGLK